MLCWIGAGIPKAGAQEVGRNYLRKLLGDLAMKCIPTERRYSLIPFSIVLITLILIMIFMVENAHANKFVHFVIRTAVRRHDLLTFGDIWKKINRTISSRWCLVWSALATFSIGPTQCCLLQYHIILNEMSNAGEVIDDSMRRTVSMFSRRFEAGCTPLLGSSRAPINGPAVSDSISPKGRMSSGVTCSISISVLVRAFIEQHGEARLDEANSLPHVF